MDTWKDIAEKEGCIYCQKQNTWCAYVNQKTGECDHENCTHDREEVINVG